MKDCCKTGDEQPDKTGKPWLKWLLYTTIGLALGFVILEQINF
ncbi:hypothetical protein [Pontibacter sp. Tf4]|nr:hypothetical protein [Pontibacter sp. Tf4]